MTGWQSEQGAGWKESQGDQLGARSGAQEADRGPGGRSGSRGVGQTRVHQHLEAPGGPGTRLWLFIVSEWYQTGLRERYSFKSFNWKESLYNLCATIVTELCTKYLIFNKHFYNLFRNRTQQFLKLLSSSLLVPSSIGCEDRMVCWWSQPLSALLGNSVSFHPGLNLSCENSLQTFKSTEHTAIFITLESYEIFPNLA